MITRFLIALLLWIAFSGCKSEDGDGQPLWREERLPAIGSNPVASVNGDVLYLREGGGGIHLFAGDVDSHLNPDGPPARADYNWSRDGAEISFSAPGEPGSETAGIFTSAIHPPGPFTRIWDRGSSPVFSLDGTRIYCAGPDNGSESEGIWRIERATLVRTRIAARGTQPKPARDDHKIAYLVSSTGSPGGLLVAYHFVTQRRDTLAARVLNMDWVDDSTLVYETLENAEPTLWTIVFMPGTVPQRLAAGTTPAAFPGSSEVAFLSLAGDVSDGLFLGVPGGAVSRISHSGSSPRPYATGKLVAQSGNQILRFTR